MPLIEIKVFENELSSEQSSDLILGITNVVTEVTSEKLRGATWVIIDEVKDGHWAVAGQPLSLADVKRMTETDL